MIETITEIVCLLTVLLGPVPLCFALAQEIGGSKERSLKASSWLLFLTFWFALTMSLGVAAGFLGVFNRGAILVLEFCLFAVGGFALKRAAGSSLPFLQALFAEDGSRLPADGWQMWMLRILGFTLLGSCLLVPATSHDSLMYHLPTMATWLHYESLERFTQWFFISTYAYGWGVVGAVFMAATDGDSDVLLPNVLAWVYLGLSVFGLALEVGARKDRALLNAGLVLSIPIVLSTSMGVQVDVPVAALFVASVYFLLKGDHDSNSSYFLVAGIALALLCGVKSSGPVYAFVVVACFGFLASVRMFRKESFRFLRQLNLKIERRISFLLFTAIFTGSYWYFRNWIEIGNPFGFVPIEVAGWTVFKMPAETERAVHDVSRGALLTLFELQNGEHWRVVTGEALRWFGIPLIAFLGLLFVTIVPWFRDGTGARRRDFVMLCGLVLLTFYLYLRTPFTGANGGQGWTITPWLGWNMRMGLPCVALLAALSSLGRWELPQLLSRLILAVAVLGGLIAIVLDHSSFRALEWTSSEAAQASAIAVWGGFTDTNARFVLRLAAYVIVGFVFTFGFKTLARRLDLRSEKASQASGTGVVAVIGLAMVLLLSGSLAFAKYRHDRAKHHLYGPIVTFMETDVRNEDTIAYAQSHRAYLFFRPGYRNRVIYRSGKGMVAEQWWNDLVSNGVDIVAFGPLNPRWAPGEAFQWVADGPLRDRFEPIFGVRGGSGPLLYRIKDEVRDFSDE